MDVGTDPDGRRRTPGPCFTVAVLVRGLPLTLLAVAVVASGCDDGASPGATDDDASALVDERVEVLAIDNAFDPEDIEVEAGTTIVWRNAGRNDHNVIPEDEDAEWRVDTESFLPGDEAEYRFTEPGTYRYYCSIHGTIDVGMPGTVVITEPGDS